MNWNEFAGKWDQFKGQVKEKWGKFTDNDLTVIAGKKDQFLGKLRERYGYNEAQAEKEIEGFMQNCGCSSDQKFDKSRQSL